jgi:hypothetical protein
MTHPLEQKVDQLNEVVAALGAQLQDSEEARQQLKASLDSIALDHEHNLAEFHSWTTTANWNANEAQHRSVCDRSAMLLAQQEGDVVRQQLIVSEAACIDEQQKVAALTSKALEVDAALVSVTSQLSTLEFETAEQAKHNDILAGIAAGTEAENKSLKATVTELTTIVSAEVESLHVERDATAMCHGELTSSYELALSNMQRVHTLQKECLADEAKANHNHANALQSRLGAMHEDSRLLTLRAEGAEEATNILTLAKEDSEATIAALLLENTKLAKIIEQPFYNTTASIRYVFDNITVGLLKLANMFLYVWYIMLLVVCTVAGAVLRASTRATTSLSARRLRNLVLIAAIYQVAFHSQSPQRLRAPRLPTFAHAVTTCRLKLAPTTLGTSEWWLPLSASQASPIICAGVSLTMGRRRISPLRITARLLARDVPPRFRKGFNRGQASYAAILPS